MGNPKQKWTSEEEEALRAGVAKHGAGKWKHIQKDPEFNHLLFSRSNIDLKDKWRNLGAASGQLPRDKSKAPKAKAIQADAPATPLAIGWTSPVTLPAQDAPAEVVIGDSSRPVPEGSNASRYDVMIFEALSTLKEPNGSDCSSIATFIEQRQQQVPQNFRRLVSSRLRRLVQQNKLEKVQNFYKIKTGAPVDTTGPSVKPNNPPPKPAPPTQSIGYRGDPIAEAAAAAAYKVAEAENKSFVAAEAVKEAERIASMAEEMEVFLQFAMEYVEKAERGEVVILK